MYQEPAPAHLLPYTTLFRSRWSVTSLVRPGTAPRAPAGTEIVEISALDHDAVAAAARGADVVLHALNPTYADWPRSEEHTSELQSRRDSVCRLLLEKKKNTL